MATKTTKAGAAKTASEVAPVTAAATTSSSPEAPVTSSEARSRFNAALEEARAGAVALRADARQRASTYADEAMARGEDWAAEAKVKVAELAVEGKNKAGEALGSLARVVDDNTAVIDEKLGQKYGDYARTASQKLQGYGTTLQDKSVDELTEDARQFVRENPGKAIGLAALAGYLISRLLRR